LARELSALIICFQRQELRTLRGCDNGTRVLIYPGMPVRYVLPARIIFNLAVAVEGANQQGEREPLGAL
jgi:hypothetical protein